MPIYLGFFDQPCVLNRTLRGDVKAKGYEGWIELTSVRFENRPIQAANGTSIGMYLGPSLTEMSVTKAQDGASASLFQQSVQRNSRLAMVVFVGDDGTVSITLVLHETIISGFLARSSASGASGERPESLTLNFAKVTYNARQKAPEATHGWRNQLKRLKAGAA